MENFVRFKDLSAGDRFRLPTGWLLMYEKTHTEPERLEPYGWVNARGPALYAGDVGYRIFDDDRVVVKVEVLQ